MSLFLSLLGADNVTQIEAQSGSSPLTDPLWWGLDSTSGVVVGPDTALKISAVYACVTLLAETIAALPLVVYRRLDDGGRERARNHPLYTVLHDRPNERQTRFQFIEMLTAHALLRGSGYARIVSGPRGFVDQLIPLHPDRVRKELLRNGRFRYVVTDDNGKPEPVNQDDIFEVSGLSFDGLDTVSVIQYARDSMGLGLAAERFGSRFFRNDSRPGGLLRTEQKLRPEVGDRLKAQWEALHTGGNQHRVAVLEQGLEWQRVGMSPDEAQFLETREFQAEDVCRWFRVPPHMIGLTSKQTSWGSGIEQMSIGFVTYTLMPWLERWQQAISRDLILAPDTYFASFVIQGLMRGDLGSRYQAYATGRQWGWLSTNDIRRLEDMNPIDNGDIYLQPMNMTEAGDDMGAVALGPGAAEEGETGLQAQHYWQLAEESAGRLVRKERMAMTRIFERADGETAVREFYAGHADLVAQTMRMPLESARNYCRDQETAVLALGGWPDRDGDIVAHLVNLAIGESWTKLNTDE
jgi:HK97 family phage portal protein